MGRDDPGDRPPERGTGDRRRSARVEDHLGYIIVLVARWQRRGFVSGVDRDEVLSVAYLEAERLLRTRYDPDRATATTFLSRYLLSRTVYALRTSAGQRKDADGWHTIAVASDTIEAEAVSGGAEAIDLDDLIAAMDPDLQPIARRIANGEDLDAIAGEYARLPLFETLLRGTDATNAAARLRQILQRDLDWIHE